MVAVGRWHASPSATGHPHSSRHLRRVTDPPVAICDGSPRLQPPASTPMSRVSDDDRRRARLRGREHVHGRARVLRQRRHRPCEDHRCNDHRLGLDAGRERALLGRHRQRGAAARGRQALAARPRRVPPARVRPGGVRLVDVRGHGALRRRRGGLGLERRDQAVRDQRGDVVLLGLRRARDRVRPRGSLVRAGLPADPAGGPRARPAGGRARTQHVRPDAPGRVRRGLRGARWDW